jgi:DNA-binding transcriptional LysR family regulator
MGQPAVSKMIAALEERIGTRLLIRSTRRLTPSEAGQAFYEHALRAIAEANEADAAAHGAGAGIEGRLRVCAPVTFARLNLVPKLDAFLSAHPRLSLDLIMDDRMIDLIAESIDVGLRLGDLTDSALIARKLASAERLVVASATYLERKGIPKTPGDLLAHDAVVYEQRSGGQEWVFKRGTSETSVALRGRLFINAAEGVREAVVAGLGFAVVSRWMFGPELASGKVVSLLPEWNLPLMDLWAIYPSGKFATTKARAFVNWFEKIMASPADAL